VHHNRLSKQTLLLFPVVVSLVVVLLGCNLISSRTPTPTPDPILSTVAALETALARHVGDAGTSAAALQTVAALETVLARQDDQIRTLYQGHCLCPRPSSHRGRARRLPHLFLP
jgi:hypothetical protein